MLACEAVAGESGHILELILARSQRLERNIRLLCDIVRNEWPQGVRLCAPHHAFVQDLQVVDRVVEDGITQRVADVHEDRGGHGTHLKTVCRRAELLLLPPLHMPGQAVPRLAEDAVLLLVPHIALVGPILCPVALGIVEAKEGHATVKLLPLLIRHVALDVRIGDNLLAAAQALLERACVHGLGQELPPAEEQRKRVANPVPEAVDRHRAGELPRGLRVPQGLGEVEHL
mmetsp:Transcript_98189/g.283292  ORF Transcript_98189/g.283292 Transcript_98189/m.283292 type:complete len:230 (-) Transcript_98189:482-1171(-)